MWKAVATTVVLALEGVVAILEILVLVHALGL
jgi:hypothetical protein